MHRQIQPSVLYASESKADPDPTERLLEGAERKRIQATQHQRLSEA